jgi:hypothetical protein
LEKHVALFCAPLLRDVYECSLTVIPVVSQALLAPNPSNNSFFGYLTRFSDDGLLAAVTSPFEPSCTTILSSDTACPSAGAVYVFSRGLSGLWQFLGYLKPRYPSAGALFGVALAVSSDGLVIAVGASGKSTSAAGVFNTPVGSSNISVFDQEAVAEQTTGAKFGAVFVFRRTSTSVWTQEAFIAPEAALSGGFDFGASIGLSKDGTVLAVSSGEYSLNGKGTVSLYRYSGASWSLDEILSSPTPSFGFFVGLSGDGRTLCVSGFGNNVQTLFYERGGGNWSLSGVISSTRSAQGHFVWNGVTVNNDGTVAVVGVDDGAIVFQLVGATWGATQQIIINTNPPLPVGVNPYLSADSLLLILGASPYVYVEAKQSDGSFGVETVLYSGTGAADGFGKWVSIGPGVMSVSNFMTGNGSVLFYPVSSIGSSPISISSQVQVNGNVTIANGAVVTFLDGGSLVVNGTVTIEPGASLSVIVTSPGVSTIINATMLVGAFGSITTGSATANVCFVLDHADYSSTTLSIKGPPRKLSIGGVRCCRSILPEPSIDSTKNEKTCFRGAQLAVTLKEGLWMDLEHALSQFLVSR